jgi:hypothetical protein
LEKLSGGSVGGGEDEKEGSVIFRGMEGGDDRGLSGHMNILSIFMNVGNGLKPLRTNGIRPFQK